MEKCFDENYIESIRFLVENNSSVLNNSENYNKVSKELIKRLDNFDEKLPSELEEEFNEIISLMYQSENYYITLAYALGAKYSNIL